MHLVSDDDRGENVTEDSTREPIEYRWIIFEVKKKNRFHQWIDVELEKYNVRLTYYNVQYIIHGISFENKEYFYGSTGSFESIMSRPGRGKIVSLRVGQFLIHTVSTKRGAYCGGSPKIRSAYISS